MDDLHVSTMDHRAIRGHKATMRRWSSSAADGSFSGLARCRRISFLPTPTGRSTLAQPTDEHLSYRHPSHDPVAVEVDRVHDPSRADELIALEALLRIVADDLCDWQDLGEVPGKPIVRPGERSESFNFTVDMRELGIGNELAKKLTPQLRPRLEVYFEAVGAPHGDVTVKMLGRENEMPD